MKSLTLLLCASILLRPDAAGAGAPLQWGPLEPGPHAVGFRSVVVRDRSRTCESRRQKTAAAQSRPIQISVWYPAEPNENAAPMPLSAYLLLADRERSLGDWSEEESQTVLARRVSLLQSDGAAEATVRERLALPSAALRDADPKAGRFPLVAFSPSMLGTPESNTVMCEFLASHGYVVAAHPSFGISPEFMTTTLRDLEAQARDLEFVIAHMIASEPSVDADRIGLIGHSWGALATLLVAARNPRIGALISLDGSEEMWRDLLDQAPEFDPAVFATPYTRLHKPKAAAEPDNGFFDSIQHAPTLRVVLDPSVQHFGFVSSLALSAWLRGSPDLEEKQRTLALVSRYALSVLDVYLRGDEAGRRFLEDPAAGQRISAKLLSVGHGPSLARVPTDAEFLSVVVERGWEAARQLYDQRVKEDSATFSEQRMVRIGEMLLWTGRYDDAALAMLELTTGRFPRSARAHEMIGNVYFWNLGEPRKALPYYAKAHQLAPEGIQVRTYLEQIEGGVR